MFVRILIFAQLLMMLGVDVRSQSAREKMVFDSAAARFQRNTHKVVLDESGKILPWTTPQSSAYDVFLRRRWNFIKTMVPKSPGPTPRSNYPQYYFYCAFKPHDGILEPDNWMNDVGEKIPNWFESARLYYAYSGDAEVMKLMSDFVDYSLEHGTSPSDFSWPNFPYTTTNAGDTLFRGFTSANRFQLHEIQVDHAGDIGLTYYRMYEFSGKKKFLKAAIDVANTLVSKVRPGTAEKSPWPYRVNMRTGDVIAEYGANWSQTYLLLQNLVDAKIGKVEDYKKAVKIIQDFVMTYPMQTGYWTDGHTDTDVKTNNYKSNLSASNMTLLMLDYPAFNPQWKRDIPKLIKWTEDFFVHRGDSSEPGTMWGANIVGEQDGYIFKMDYQTARYGAECARWAALSGDSSFKEKAYRSLNWVTYCSDSNGMAFECPLSVGISNWYSDTYGEGPRMFYPAMAAVPEWAPPGENHILYSIDVMQNVVYGEKKIGYTVAGKNGIDYVKTNFAPRQVTLNGVALAKQTGVLKKGYSIKKLANGDYHLIIKRGGSGNVVIKG